MWPYRPERRCVGEATVAEAGSHRAVPAEAVVQAPARTKACQGEDHAAIQSLRSSGREGLPASLSSVNSAMARPSNSTRVQSDDEVRQG
jgi:hypothetical protein